MPDSQTGSLGGRGAQGLRVWGPLKCDLLGEGCTPTEFGQ